MSSSGNQNLALSLKHHHQLPSILYRNPKLLVPNVHVLSWNHHPVPVVSSLPLPSTRACSLLVRRLQFGSSSAPRRNPTCWMSNSGKGFLPLARDVTPLEGTFFQKFSQTADLISQLELEKPDRKPVNRANGIFWIILLNLGIFAADHLFQVRGIQSLYLYHNWPAWYQFVTATFCHADWNHLSSNLFFLYIFGKLVEEEEGNLALWFAYILTGAGANLVSWLILPRNSISVGASGAVFGLFSISVLVKMSWDWRKILEVLILGQFVIKRVMEAAQASAGLSSSSSLQSINHIAHLSGALVGVFLVWLLSRFPAEPTQKS